MYGRVAPALVVEPSCLVQVVKEAQVSLVTEYGKRGHLEVAPKLKAANTAFALLVVLELIVEAS